ncbi:MAG: NAD(P)/FAD-dependent oxidoreductase [Bacteroidota bacterium]
MHPTVIIIGAGLTGLRIAHLLEQRGISYRIIEARERLGGRIHTLISENDTKLEMGATWFGHQHTQLKALFEELEIGYYEQFMTGSAYFEAFSTAPPQRMDVPSDPPSFRIKGGSSQLIEKLAKGIPSSHILLAEKVLRLEFQEEEVIVQTDQKELRSKYIISTLPPALMAHSIEFEPALPTKLAQIAQETHTWMQDSIKVALVYEESFWTKEQLSGTLFSQVGPFTELYDHSDHLREKAALCGFVNAGYAQLEKEDRQKRILNQLGRIFGEKAALPLAYEETIWAHEPFTKDPAQTGHQVFPHQHNGHDVFQHTYYNGRLYLSGTETSAVSSGYMDGAIFAAKHAVAKLEEVLLENS